VRAEHFVDYAVCHTWALEDCKCLFGRPETHGCGQWSQIFRLEHWSVLCLAMSSGSLWMEMLNGEAMLQPGTCC